MDRGAYPSAEVALNAALAVVETAAAPGFDGTREELGTLLLESLRPPEVTGDFSIDGESA